MTIVTVTDGLPPRRRADTPAAPPPLFTTTTTPANRRFMIWLANRIGASKSRGVNDISVEVTELTPADCEFILRNHNKGNRPVRASRVKKFAALIKEGRFILTSQGISFDRDGRLLNGQHRLMGAVEAARNIKVAVAFNEPAGAFEVIDLAGTRTG